ncbi:FAD-dependent oxidoreductase [Aquibium oceanicum]|uniref:Monooxygenase n=1 Tax=Aquibium oceanicum TaxID=1670800 RepID=A0A1L3STM2_9HYPH|nr:NAD(P)/FAD-dependent oxidoreductase [Aquibium oceanicum]APH72756.1 monooxygenase [Aquibium oceanicum]
MPAKRNLRILIAGAGPVGLTAALELARRGYRPRIVDEGDDLAPAVQSRALAVNARTLFLLEPSGVTEKLLAEAQQICEMRIGAGVRRLMTIDLLATDSRHRGMHALPQGRTERILAEALAAYGIAVEWRTECVAVSDPEIPVATLALPDGSRKDEPFDIVIGADGAHSTMRKSAGFDFPGSALSETFYLADYRYAAPVDTSYAEARFFDPGVIARLPVSPSILRYVSTLPDFRERIEHPAPVDAVLWESDFHVSFRHTAQMAKGNIFLAGDAAHIHSPVGGRGMNLGIEDACWLAWLIDEGRTGEYTRLRLTAVETVLADTRRMTRLILMRNPILCALRNLAVPLLAAIPRVRQEGLNGVLGLDTPAPPWLPA